MIAPVTRRGHDAAADFVVPHYVEDRFVELVELGEQYDPRREHCSGDLLERLMAGYELADALLEVLLRNLADLEPKAPENAANALDVDELVLQLLASDQHLLRTMPPASRRSVLTVEADSAFLT
jgi:hypothetical protein